ncbi:MAG: hypothetical protein PUB94_03385 [Oscillospiraceae bacterium]|nr:hypothetical protein [Oscillospiraceae bacterium]
MVNLLTEMNKAKALISGSETVTAGNKIVTGFSTGIVPSPLKSLYTVVKPLELQVEKIEKEGVSSSNLAKFKMGINIHKAEKLDPSELLGRFSEIVDLFEQSSDFTVYSSGFGELQRNADTNSIFLPGYIVLAYYY